MRTTTKPRQRRSDTTPERTIAEEKVVSSERTPGTATSNDPTSRRPLAPPLPTAPPSTLPDEPQRPDHVLTRGEPTGPSRCFPFWQEVLACYVSNTSPEDDRGKVKCQPVLEDYYECLHHKKEVRFPASSPNQQPAHTSKFTLEAEPPVLSQC